MTGHEDLSIELGEKATYQCPCCNRESQTVHGFLWDRTGRTSVYFAGFTSTHAERKANLVVSVGGWGEGTTPADRHAVPLQVLKRGDELVFELVRPEESPWHGEEELGEMPKVDELSDEDIAWVKVLAKFAVENDPRVDTYFRSE